MVHKHSHSTDKNLSGKKLLISMILNLIITIAEIIGGIFSNSLALLSDAIHNLNDTSAIAISYFANKMAQRPSDHNNTFGYKRTEVLAAFINISMLIVIAFYLIYESIQRFLNPQEINTNVMLPIALIGLFGNLFSILLLQKDSKENINIKSAFLHLLFDTISSVFVVITAIILIYYDLQILDPIITLIISGFIFYSSWGILKNTITVLMNAVPSNININEIKKSIEIIDNVNCIHHIHVWYIASNQIEFSCHTLLENMNVFEMDRVRNEINDNLRKFGITHTTIQFEGIKCNDTNSNDHGVK